MSAGREALVAAARGALEAAYAPYSGFLVGAAIRLDDGSIVTGANLENASYGLSLCAEAVALALANLQGGLARVEAIAVAGGRRDGQSGDAPTLPCGRCRQLLHEAAALGGRDILVHAAARDGDAIVTYRLSELLPHAFGPDRLQPGAR